MNPLHGNNMVRQAAVAVKLFTAGIAGKIIKTEDVQTVLEADIYNPVADEGFAVVQLVGGTAGVVAAAVDINQYGKFLSLHGSSDV